MCPPCRWSRFVTAGAAAGRMCRGGRGSRQKRKCRATFPSREPLVSCYRVMPPDVTLWCAEQAALGLLGQAGVVAVRVADPAARPWLRAAGDRAAPALHRSPPPSRQRGARRAAGRARATGSQRSVRQEHDLARGGP